MKKNKVVYGIGINDADYVVKVNVELGYVDGVRRRKQVWVCPYYSVWKGILQRCYDPKRKEIFTTYKNCTVCEEWLTFSNFKRWMEQQDWEGKHLDKDILFPGNKVYSPETCVFVSPLVNTFITERDNDRGNYPIGVSWKEKNGKYQASCSQLNGVCKYLGLFDTPEEAHQAWLNEKLRLARLLALQQTDERVAKALIDRYENYGDRD